MRYLLCSVLTLFGISLLAVSTPAAGAAKPLKVGIIGLDTSHVVAFTKLLNDPNAKGELAGIRVVAAFPAGSPDIPASKDRLAGFTKDLKEKYGVEIVDSIDALLPKVDAVLLESVDGRPHLEQVKPVLKAGKPVFIDKPLAGSLADAIQIFELAREHKVPCFSSSSLRFTPAVQGMKTNPKVGKIRSCESTGPCSLEPHHPDLFWYGVHGCEALFTIMGTGCETVTREHSKDLDVVKGVWKDGRTGTFRGPRPGTGYSVVVTGSEGTVTEKSEGGYTPLVVEICKFFRTGKPPVSAEETIEIFAFMEAADESKRQNGATVKIADVLAKAKAEIGRKKP